MPLLILQYSTCPIILLFHIIIIYSINTLFFSLPSSCLYQHSFASFLGWPTHSSAFSFCSFTSLQYCEDSTVSLCCGLKFSLSTSNSPMLVLHFSYSLSFNVSMNYSPFVSSQLNIMGTFQSGVL